MPDPDDRHGRLLRLAGQIPDETLTRARDLLAAGAFAEVDGLWVVATGDRVPDVDAWRASETAPAFGFAPAGPEVLAGWGDQIGQTLDLTEDREPGVPGLVDDIDAAAVTAVAGLAGVIGLWRAWRFPTAASAPIVRIYLVEVVTATPAGALAHLTGHLQDALRAAGLATPMVEVYDGGRPLPAYQRLARSSAALLWAHTPWRRIRLARTFDAGDPPRFDPDHAVLSGAVERAGLLSSLRGGALLLTTVSLMDDVVSGEPGVVPIEFRTDGHWIWTTAAVYYCDRYGLAPDPLLVRHFSDLVAAGPVDGVDLHRAMAVLST